MSKKLLTLTLAAASAAVLALPAMASAAVWDLNTAPAGAFTVNSSTTTTLTNTNNEVIECSTTKGSGSYSTASSGTMSLTFTGCKTPSFFNTTCNSPGAASGEIKYTSGLGFQNIYLDFAHTKLGILLSGTGSEEHIGTISCSGFLTFKLTGTALGEVEKKCGDSGTSFPISFEQISNGQPRWKQVEEGGSIYDLTVDNLLDGTSRTGALRGTAFLNFVTSRTIQCT